MRLRFIQLLSLLVIVPAASSHAQEPVGGLPEDLLPELRPILQAALQRSPQMISSSIVIAQAEANRYNTDAPLWPSVNFNGNYGQNSASTAADGNIPSSSNSSNGLSYYTSLGQPIFQWGALRYRADYGRIAVKIAEHQYADAYRMLAGTLRSQYLSLIAKRAGLRYSQNNVRLATANLQIEEAKFKEGTIAVGELVPPRLTLAEAQLLTDRAVADFAASKRMFMRAAGVTDLADDSIPSEIPAPTHSAATATQLLETFLRDGPGSTIQGQIYLMTLKQADLNYRIAKTGLLPKFSLSGSYGLSFNTDVTAGKVHQSQVTTRNFGLSANWAIFDGFATRGSKLFALASKRATERLLQTYTESTIDGIQSARQQLEFSARSLALTEQRRGMAKDGAARAENDFKTGLISQAVLESSNSNFLGTNAAATFARADYLKSWADFVSQIGADPVMTNLPAQYVRPIK